MRRRLGILVWALVCLIWAAAPVRAEVANQVLAVVGEDVITMLDLEKLIGPMVERIRVEQQGTDVEGKIAALRSQALDQMIVELLTSGEALRLGIKVRKADVDGGIDRILEMNKIDLDDLVRTLAKDGITLDEYREQIKGQILRARLVYSTVKAKIVISEKKKLELYESRKEKYQTVREIELRRIVLPKSDPDQAAAVRERIVAGEDFTALAKELSQGPEAGDGGLLGYFKLEQLSEVIREAVQGLEEGQVSQPVDTREGLQLFMFSGTKVKEGKPYEEVEPILADELLQKELDREFGEMIKEVRKRTYVKIIPVKSD
jgi:peptidyl-prolyl cis-trans isomerase SurA